MSLIDEAKLEEAKAVALAVKAGQWTSYHLEQLADYVLHFAGHASAPAEPVAPVVEVHLEGADAPKTDESVHQ